MTSLRKMGAQLLKMTKGTRTLRVFQDEVLVVSRHGFLYFLNKSKKLSFSYFSLLVLIGILTPNTLRQTMIGLTQLLKIFPKSNHIFCSYPDPSYHHLLPGQQALNWTDLFHSCLAIVWYPQNNLMIV